MTSNDVCDVCGNEPALIRNLENDKWYCISCAANAGEPTAIMLRGQREADKIMERLMMPVKDIGEAA